MCVCGEDRQDRTGKGRELQAKRGEKERERESEGANRREFEHKINTEIIKKHNEKTNT